MEATIEFFQDDRGGISQLVLAQRGRDNPARRAGYKREASPIDGTWTAIFKGSDGNPIEVTCALEQPGKILLGTVNTRLGGGPFSEGKTDGTRYSFVVRTDQFTIETSGVLVGDEIRITRKNASEVLQFSARYQDAKIDTN